VWQKYREKYSKTHNIAINNYIIVLYNIMPSKRLSPALIPVQGGGVKKAGLPGSIGSSVLFKIICKSAGCIKK